MPQITPIKGFTNTPVTRSVCVVSTVATLALLILALKQYLHLAVDPYIIQYSQYWRVATFQFAVVNESDYMLSTILWFHFKTLERFFGPRKYLLLVAVFALYNAAATFLVLSLAQLLVVFLCAAGRMLLFHDPLRLVYFDSVFNLVVPGPVGILALLYVCHGAYIPVLYHFKVLLRKPAGDADASGLLAAGAVNSGTVLTFTNHFQIHVVFLVYALNNGFQSLIPAAVGFLIGHLYTHDLLAGSKTWVLPSVVFRFFVAPGKVRRTTARDFRRRLQGYRSVLQIPQVQLPEPTPEREDRPDGEDEDREVAIDDIRHEDENAAARSTTPVRPLGRQFLDTFRA